MSSLNALNGLRNFLINPNSQINCICILLQSYRCYLKQFLTKCSHGYCGEGIDHWVNYTMLLLTPMAKVNLALPTICLHVSLSSAGANLIRVVGPTTSILCLLKLILKLGYNCTFQHIVYHINFTRCQLNQNTVFFIL